MALAGKTMPKLTSVTEYLTLKFPTFRSDAFLYDQNKPRGRYDIPCSHYHFIILWYSFLQFCSAK